MIYSAVVAVVPVAVWMMAHKPDFQNKWFYVLIVPKFVLTAQENMCNCNPQKPQYELCCMPLEEA